MNDADLSVECRRRPEPGVIWRTRKLIHEHLGEKLALSWLARTVHISPTYLSEKFKEVTGENIVCYIARARVEQAKQLLSDGDRRVSEIAFAVGFQSLSQFNRVFKKFSGGSPSQDRSAKARVFPQGR